MNSRRMLCTIALIVVVSLSACSIFNPFVGKWKSGILKLDFKSDKTFTLVIGHSLSVNLEGDYSYDDDTLTLGIDGDTDVTFTYTFTDGKKELTLAPMSDFEYIKSKIEFEKQ
jgi:hypothetical protein